MILALPLKDTPPIVLAVVRVAAEFNIPLIFFSEDGDVEYGGDAKYKNKGIYGIDYQKTNYIQSSQTLKK